MNGKKPREHALRQYRAKRDFKTTPEPSGSRAPKTARPKGLLFCVQKHLASHLHYDFRLEHAGVLLSWAVPKGPSLDPADKRLAMRTEDHPLDYGDFEGVIPQGYGAGIVMLWDRGTWKPLSEDVDAAVRKGELKFELSGKKLKGSWVLVRTRSAGGRSWLLIKHRDRWAGESDVTGSEPLSVKSGRDFARILANAPDVWESHLSAKGGATGEMLRRIVEEAAELIASGQAEGTQPKRRSPASSNSTVPGRNRK